EDVAMRSDQDRHLERRITDAAADVEHALSLAELRRRHHAQRERPREGLEERLPAPPSARHRPPFFANAIPLVRHRLLLSTAVPPAKPPSLQRGHPHATSAHAISLA